MQLADIGWSGHWQTLLDAASEHGVPGRVARAEAASATMWTEAGELAVRIPSRFKGPEVRPVVGDWAVVAPAGREHRIVGILPRSTAFARRAAGRRVQVQVVAANVDVVFVVSGLDGDFSPRRLERYLTTVSETGARPVILLTKAGLVEDPGAFVLEAKKVAPDVMVHAIDVIDGVDAEAPSRYLRPGSTAALVGSSGVGKSTLLNHWLGEQRQPVRGVRGRDHRGQHTTTAREMFVSPAGALVIDTPGMRELALWAEEGALDEAFSDVDVLAAQCRFNDCRHLAEPGCAVREAVEDGTMARDRFDSYLTLREEIHQTWLALPEHLRRRRGKGLSREIKQAKALKRGR